MFQKIIRYELGAPAGHGWDWGSGCSICGASTAHGYVCRSAISKVEETEQERTVAQHQRISTGLRRLRHHRGILLGTVWNRDCDWKTCASSRPGPSEFLCQMSARADWKIDRFDFGRILPEN